MQANRRLQIRTLQRLAEHAAKFAVHANVHIGFHQARYIGQMATQREHHIDFSAYALHQAADLSQVARAIKGAVARPDDVHARTLTDFALALGYFAQTVLLPQPEHGAVGALPLVFVNRARQEALQIRTFWRDATTNHFGDRTGHHD